MLFRSKIREYYFNNKDKIKQTYEINKSKISLYNKSYWALNKNKYDYCRHEYNNVKKTLINVDIAGIVNNLEKNENGFIIRF